MSLENEKLSLDELIEQLQEEQRQKDEREAFLNIQIAAIKLEIAKLKDERFTIKKKTQQAYVDKESIDRKIEMEKEATRIQQTIEEKRTLVKELIESAPWKDDAYKWQIDGAIQLPERALLADKRGMGKTLSAIIWLKVQKAKKTLICVRSEVAYDFMKELSLREPKLFVYPVIGANSDERDIAAKLLAPFDEFVVITNIESWRRNVDKTTEALLKIDYDAIILDEAHHIKNINTGTAQGFLKLSKKISKVLELTGTPIQNRPQEMFTLLHALYPHLFPIERKFLVDFCMPAGQNRWVFTAMGLKSLVAKISSFYLARSPEDVGREVPPPRVIEYKLSLENHPLQREAYKLMTERSMAMLSSGKVIPIVSQLAIMTRQAQMVSWPAGIRFEIKNEEGYVEEVVKFDIHESVKADWAEEFVQELVAGGERVVLFSRFKPVIYELKGRLEEAGLSVAVVTGDEKGSRKEIFDDFDLKTASKDNYKNQVLLATYQTIGESANLNAARHVILYDRFWNPGKDDQAIGRVDRINSIDQATVHLPEVELTIDEYMIELINSKRSMVQDFRSAADQQASLAAHLSRTL